jgi:hypothetical protein
MPHILIRRDQFNITPEGILHKPTDARFVPSPADRWKGTFHEGHPGASRSGGESYDADEVRKVMLQLWTEYVSESSGTTGRGKEER